MRYPATVLVVGATGSIGSLVVQEAHRQGYPTRALVRDARNMPLADEPQRVREDLADLAGNGLQAGALHDIGL